MARDFDGSTGHLGTASPSALDAPGQRWTLACWANWDSVLPGAGYALMTHAYSGGAIPMVLGIADGSALTASPGQLAVGHYSGGWQARGWGGTVLTGKWYHVCGSYDGSVFRLYVNGVLVNSGAGGSATGNTNEFRLGRRWDGTARFDGKMVDAAVWFDVLQGAEVAALARGAKPGRIRPGSLRAWWPLDDYGPGDNGGAVDLSYTRQDVTLTGAVGMAASPGPYDAGAPFYFGVEEAAGPTDIAGPFLNVGTGLFAPASVTESGIFAPFLNVGVGLFAATYLDLVYAPFLNVGTGVSNPTMIDGEPPPFVPPSLPGASPGGGPGGSLPPLSSGGLAGIRFYQGPPWRWVVTDLDTQTITFLDRLAAEAVVTYGLDRVWTAKLSVPSDNPEVNILHTDGEPFISEGNRLLYGFRREGGEPKWVCRFAGKILHVEDTGEAEDARTIITAYDPRQILYQRAMVNYAFEFPDKAGFFSFDNTQTGVIALTFLRNTIVNSGELGIDVGNLDFATVDNMPGSGYWGGAYVAPWSYRTKSEYETTTQVDVDCQQGMMVGEVWDQMIETGSLDLLLTPVYDPIRRPGIMAELGIYQRLGDVRYESVMAWDKPGRNLRAFNSIRDGTKRANTIRYYADQGGPPVGPYLGYSNGTSITKYGETWHEEFWPSRIAAAVDALAQLQLTLMENGIHTVEVTPTPERMPFLFTEWFLGDTVPVYTSDKARQENAGFQRIYGIVLNIDENSYEQVPQVLTSPEA